MARHAIGSSRSGTRVASRPGTGATASRSPKGSRQGQAGTGGRLRGRGAARALGGRRTAASPTIATSGVSQPMKTSSSTPDPTAARQEVGDLGRVPLDLRERAPVPIEPATAQRSTAIPAAHRRSRAHARLPPLGPAGGAPRRSRAPTGSRRARDGAAPTAGGRQGTPRRARTGGARARGASREGGTRRAPADARSTVPRGTA